MIACNELYVAMPWANQGSTAVFCHQGYGRIGANPPMLLGHEGAVIDIQFNPFDSSAVFTASEDGSIMGWKIPEGGLRENCTEAVTHLKAHEKKCGTIAFHPSVNGVLGSAGLDKTVKVWDVEKAEARTTVSDFEDYPMDLSWNMDGSEVCVVSRDKKLSVVDARDGTVASSGVCHDSARALRCVWAKRRNQIITCGWDNMQRRQMKVWDTRKLTRPISTVVIDQGSAAMMPMYDEDLNLLYVGFKGEGAIRAYELIEGSLVFSHEQASSESVKGLCMFPKQCLDVKQCEIGRIYELTQHNMMTIHMHLPRKQCESEFQKDVYPSTFADKPALTADEFFKDGKTSVPREFDLDYLFNGTKRVIKKAIADDKKGDPLAVKALKKSTKKEHPSAHTHVDPSSNMVHRPSQKDNEEIGKLLALLEAQRSEVDGLRKQVAEKEAEMMNTLRRIQDALKS